MSDQQQAVNTKATTIAEPLRDDTLGKISGGVRRPNVPEKFATIDVKAEPQPQQLQDIIAIL